MVYMHCLSISNLKMDSFSVSSSGEIFVGSTLIPPIPANLLATVKPVDWARLVHAQMFPREIQQAKPPMLTGVASESAEKQRRTSLGAVKKSAVSDASEKKSPRTTQTFSERKKLAKNVNKHSSAKWAKNKNGVKLLTNLAIAYVGMSLHDQVMTNSDQMSK
jgi:hypothetical protein